MRFLVLTIFLLASCEESPSSNPSLDTTTSQSPSYRYFDREIHLSRGSSVTPDHLIAQEIIKAALEDLEKNTDLGAGYFIFNYEDDSILQPVATRTQAGGRGWKSFIQTWDDNLLNEYLSQSGGENPDGDQDIIVAKNIQNTQQFYILTRLPCFLAGASCGYASQQQAKMLVWRSFGYLIGLRVGDNAASAIMKPFIDSNQETSEEQRKFLAEFNSRLELIKNQSRGL